MLKKGDKVGIVCCSNGQKEEMREKLQILDHILREMELYPVWNRCIFEKEYIWGGTARERAEILMNCYLNDEIRAVFDISGGDIANEILPFLNFNVIAESEKEFWGYSDLTTIINAIYAKTQKTSVLYQVKNMLYQEKQIMDFQNSVLIGQDDLFTFPYRFVRGEKLEGIVVGGNIRCLLKLAGTDFFPEMKGKVLMLEALHGGMAQIITYLSQLQQIGVFSKISGILLGTFTEYEENRQNPAIEELVMRYLPAELPVVKTDWIGHGRDSKAVRIGEKIVLS